MGFESSEMDEAIGSGKWGCRFYSMPWAYPKPKEYHPGLGFRGLGLTHKAPK